MKSPECVPPRWTPSNPTETTKNEELNMPSHKNIEQLDRFEPSGTTGAMMARSDSGEYVQYSAAKEIIDALQARIDDLQDRLDTALDILDECHGMDMYWDEYPDDGEDEDG